MNRVFKVSVIFLIVLNFTVATASAQGTTAFNFQGQLKVGGSLANGNFDFLFNLFDGSNPFTSNQMGIDQALNVPVEDGIFIVELDFGPGIFDGTELWLQIVVQEVGDPNLVALSPLQQITPVPYATHAVNSSELDGLDSTDFLRRTAGCDICVGHADSEGSSPDREQCFDLSSDGRNNSNFLQFPSDVDENDRVWIWMECP